MIVDIPESMTIILSKILSLDKQLESLPQVDSKKASMDLIITGIEEQKNELRIELSIILEKSVLKMKEK